MKKYPVVIALTALALAGSHTAMAQGLMNNGGRIVLTGAAQLVINDGGLTNNATGVITPGSGTVRFTGTTGNGFIDGTAPVALYNMEVAKGTRQLTLGVGTAIANTLTMTSGTVDLGNSDISFGSTGSITGETNTTYVTATGTGGMTRTATLNAPSAANPGNLGVAITAAQNLGVTTIRRAHMQPSAPGGYGILRTYQVTPANNTALNATVSFSYLDHELAGITESSLNMWYSPNGSSSWAGIGVATLNTTTDVLTVNGVNSMGSFALASNATPLPLQLLSFTGSLAGDATRLQWTVAAEQGIAAYEVEHSPDGVAFGKLGTVTAGGTAGNDHTYPYTDTEPFMGITYYRLRIVAAAGTFTYSNTIAVQRTEAGTVQVYPNPFSGTLYVNYYSAAAETITARLTDTWGRVVLQQDFSLNAGPNTLQLSTAALAAGTYYFFAGANATPVKVSKLQ